MKNSPTSPLPTPKHPFIAVVLDNHGLFADSFGKMIESLSFFEDVQIFTDKGHLISFLIKLPPQTHGFFFLDYYLGEDTALPVISDIKRICSHSHIVIVSVATSPSLLRSLMDHKKVEGVLSKYSGANDVNECIDSVINHKKFISPYLKDILGEGNAATKIPLSDRELEIVQYAAQGMTVNLTADKMNISRHTVAAHRRKILAKTGCASVSELLELARKMKWI